MKLDNPRFAAPTQDEGGGAPDGVVWATRKSNMRYLMDQYRLDQQERFPGASDLGTDKAFAEHVGVSAKYLGHIKSARRNIGNHLARRIEAACSLPIGWLDVTHTDATGRTDDERDYIRGAMQLYNESPDEARRIMLRELGRMLAARGKS